MEGTTISEVIPEIVLSAYDLLLQHRIVERIVKPISLDMSSKITQWTFVCLIKVPIPNPNALPELIEIEVIIPETFPYSPVQCISRTEKVFGFPHQDAETGKLCLPEESLAPVNEERLVCYINWTKEWLKDAANNTLVTLKDPYELPDFSRKFYKVYNIINRTFLFEEDNKSYSGEWESYIGKTGTVKCYIPWIMDAVLVSQFLDINGRTIHESKFSELIYNKKHQIEGHWVIVKDIYFENYRPPQTYEELDSIFNDNALNLNQILKKAWSIDNQQKECGFILVGFPIPQYFFGDPIEIHWTPLVFPNVRSDKKTLRDNHKSNKPMKIWERLLQERFLKTKQLPWVKSTNISSERLFSRGSLNPSLKVKVINLFGCGAIGSIVAESLVRGGVKSLILNDSDSILMGNLCRHTLDGRNIGESKASALALKLATINPLSSCKANILSIPLLSSQVEEQNNITNSDIIIDCTADHTAFLWLCDNICIKQQRMISLFFNFNAKVMTLIISGRMSNCNEIFNDLMNNIKNGITGIDPKEYFRNPSKEEQVLEGAGCWQPTFPGLNIHIQLLTATAIDIINNSLVKENGVAVIIKRNAEMIYEYSTPIIETTYYNDNYE